MVLIFKVDAPCGGGKTYALARHACSLAASGKNVIIPQPTKGLLDQTLREVLTVAPDVSAHAIHSGNTLNVVDTIMGYAERAAPGAGEVLLVTHAALERLPYLHRRSDWTVLVDEAPAVDYVQEFRLQDTHRLISNALTVRDYDHEYSMVEVVDRALVERIARNANRDAVYALLADLANRALSLHWELFVRTSHWSAMLDGRGGADERSLWVHGILRPSFLAGFERVTILSAAFDETMACRLWTALGARFHDDTKLAGALRYSRHPNGHLLTISYLTDQDWSKRFRDRPLDGDPGRTVLAEAVSRVGAAFKGEDFVWQGNKDLPDDLFDAVHNGHARPGRAIRLPQVAHGLNCYTHIHNVAILSALNPPPAHFGFLTRFGVNGDEARTAIFRQQVYQAANRISLRNPDDPTPKRMVVPDRGTAEWVAGMFPGAAVAPLGGTVVGARKCKPGRDRQYATAAEKQAAHRARKREREVALALLNHLNFEFGAELQPVADRLLATLPEFQQPLPSHADGPGFDRGDMADPSKLAGTVYGRIFDRAPLGHVEGGDAEGFIATLRDLADRELEAKEQSGLFTPAVMDPSKSADTARGLANVRSVWGVWLDCDGGDLAPDDLAAQFPTLRMAVFNTYSSSPEAPRWRAFIPTSIAMTVEVHRLVVNAILTVLNRSGYWSARQLRANTSIKVRRTHGLDESKFHAASLFYLPCRSRYPEGSFFKDYADARRSVLDVWAWAEKLLDSDSAERAIAAPVQQPLKPRMENASTKLGQLAARLRMEAQASAGRSRERMIAEAIDAWRAAGKGDGNAAFFRLACSLAAAGVDRIEAQQILHREAGLARSPVERRREVKSLMRRYDGLSSRHGRAA